MTLLVSGVRRLSRGFTGNRRLVGHNYLEDPELLGAYLLFYWPVSYAQARTVLADLDRRNLLKTGAAIDLGSGPGPLSFALFDSGFKRVIALEKVDAALDIAREIASSAGIPIANVLKPTGADPTASPATTFGATGVAGFATLRWEASLTGQGLQSHIPEHLKFEKFGLVACGHMLNELGPVSKADGIAPASTIDLRVALIRDFSKLMSPDGSLVILEPALKSVTRNLLALRDRIAASGTEIRGPCFFTGPCPALALPDQTCHGQVNWKMPETLRKLSEAAHIDKNELAMAWLATGPVVAVKSETRGQKTGLSEPSYGAASEGPWRVVSEPMLNKAGRTRFMICGPKGRISLSLKRGDLAKTASEGQKTESLFFSLGRGAVVEIDNAEERENGLGVTASTLLRRL